MLKRVHTSQIEMGMFIHKLEGSWLSHPFWKKKFLLEDSNDLALLRESTVDAVLIDTDKGKDVAAVARVPSMAAPIPVAAFGRATVSAQSYRPPVRQPDRLAARPFDPLSTHSAPLSEELARAQKLVGRSKQLVAKVFGDVRLGRAIKAEKVEALVEEMACSMTRNPHALTSLARLKQAGEYAYMHSVAVSALMMNLARHLDMPDTQVREAGLAGLLHDIGNVQLPADLLERPDALNEEERAVMRTHVRLGYDMMKENGDIHESILDACLHHHERLNGSGYPDGLIGTHIGLYARMVAICDVYDAMTSDRPYRKGNDPAEALVQMGEMQGQFDPDIMSAFVRGIGIYPIGSLVRLRSDRLAVVVDQNRDDYTLPIVKAFYAIERARRITPEVIDLARSYGNDEVVGREHPDSWHFENWDQECLKMLGCKAPRRLAA